MVQTRSKDLDFFEGKGAHALLKALEDQERRWKDIEIMVSVSPRTLSQRISEAMELGLIKKKKHLTGGTTYTLTEKGKKILARERKREDARASTLERQGENSWFMYFPRCPVCHGERLKLKKICQGRKDYLLCFSCGAKWHLKLKSDGFLREAKLVAEGADGQGANILDEAHEADFWLREALRGSTPWPKKKNSKRV